MIISLNDLSYRSHTVLYWRPKKARPSKWIQHNDRTKDQGKQRTNPGEMPMFRFHPHQKPPYRKVFGVPGLLSVLISTKSFFLNSLCCFIVNIFPQKLIQNRCRGNCQQHAQDTHDAAANRNGSKYPNSGKTDGGANHLRIDQIALQLLQYKLPQ